ncbi:MAG: amidohydrolase [Acidobacteria bacterium]|nr:amidohydrolase [Acidobacteriota bacterium]
MAEELKTPPEITDVHVHIQPWDQLRPAVQQRMALGRSDFDLIQRMIADPAVFLDHLDATGVARAGIINYPSPDIMGFDDRATAFCARWCAVRPDRLIAFGGVHPRFTKSARDDMNRILDMGIRGIKLHPPHQVFELTDYREKGLKSLETIFSIAQERKVPVMIHTGTSIFPGARSRLGDPMGVDDVAIDFPELKVILAHGGRPLWGETAIFLLRRFPNVHMDISGIPPRRLLHYFPRLADFAEKVLYGSDWPAPGVPSLREILDGVASIPLPPEARAKIMGGNARRLFL